MNLPASSSLVLHKILIVPATRILCCCMWPYPCQRHGASLTVTQRDRTGPYFMLKRLALPPRRPSLLALHDTALWQVDTHIIAINGRAIILAGQYPGIAEGRVVERIARRVNSDLVMKRADNKTIGLIGTNVGVDNHQTIIGRCLNGRIQSGLMKNLLGGALIEIELYILRVYCLRNDLQYLELL